MPQKPVRLGRSLTGLGLFATKEIKKRARIAQYRGRLLTTKEAERLERGNRNRYMFELNSRWTIDGTPRYNVARYINHSCNPNAEPSIYRGRVFIRALRRIKPGEEITYSYGGDYLRNVIGKSNCKCGRCRRRRAKQQREARLRKKTRERRAAQQRAATRRTKTTKATSRRTSRP
jgi:SET domain-containing protein